MMEANIFIQIINERLFAVKKSLLEWSVAVHRAKTNQHHHGGALIFYHKKPLLRILADCSNDSSDFCDRQ